jgi:hypothetical protein
VEICDLHCSPNIIIVSKYRRMGWAGNVARVGRREVHMRFWVGNTMEINYLEDLGVDGKIIFKSTLHK